MSVGGSLEKKIITSALPYSYSIPHLGNFVGSILPADVYFKYSMMNGDDAIFISGSDQHGTPIELKAIEEKKDPENLSNEIHAEIKDLFERFGCTFTYYGKTHTDYNKEVVYSVFDALYKKGYILEIEGEQAYCNIDKRFLLDRFIEGRCPHCGGRARGDQCDDCGKLLEPTQIIDPICNLCKRKEIVFKHVKNLAVDLAKLQPKIKSFIEKNSKNNWSKNAVNKSLSYIDEGLKPREITRNIKWGFPVPKKGFEDMVFYVWFDAFLGYIGITKEWDSERWKDYWLDSKARLIQVMGKDNIEFHTLMWPGVLIGSEMGFILPYTIKASEYLTSKTIKFSKSRGVGLNLKSAIEILEPDYWRFVLMYLYPETADSEFSAELLEEIVNTVMNDKVGNFVQRALKIFASNRASVGEKMQLDDDTRKKAEEIISSYKTNFEKMNLREALHSAVELASLGNSILSTKEPWLLIRKGDQVSLKEFSETISSLIVLVHHLSLLLWPFVPTSSMEVLSYFGIFHEPDFKLLEADVSVVKELDPRPIFRKMGKDEIARLEQFSGK